MKTKLEEIYELIDRAHGIHIPEYYRTMRLDGYTMEETMYAFRRKCLIDISRRKEERKQHKQRNGGESMRGSSQKDRERLKKEQLALEKEVTAEVEKNIQSIVDSVVKDIMKQCK